MSNFLSLSSPLPESSGLPALLPRAASCISSNPKNCSSLQRCKVLLVFKLSIDSFIRLDNSDTGLNLMNFQFIRPMRCELGWQHNREPSVSQWRQSTYNFITFFTGFTGSDFIGKSASCIFIIIGNKNKNTSYHQFITTSFITTYSLTSIFMFK